MTTETQSDMVERVKGYIQHQAAKDDSIMLKLAEEGHAQLLDETDGLSEAQAVWKSAPDEWSVLDCMQHVVAAKKGTARLCHALAAGELPKGLGGEGEEVQKQDGVTGRTYESLTEARDAAMTAHAELLAFANGVTESTNLEARYDHFIFGALNCREWAVFQRVHDGDHAQQIAKVKASEGFPA
jgi:hypothetical protein